MINVEVEKGHNENNASLIRRFTKRMQSAQIVRHVRTLRYHVRPASANTKKRQALKSIERREKYEDLAKQGKIVEKTRRGR